jgi:hypothetical protein
MLIVFIFILLIGLAGFAFVFTRALKSGNVPEPVGLRPLDRLPPGVTPEPSGGEVVIPAAPSLREDALKVAKLEQMLVEKNNVIEGLQKSLRSGDDHDAQIESLKQIFQAQIEELKQQNKQLKDEVSRLSGENLDLQTKVYAGQAPASPAVEQIVIHPGASTSPAEEGPAVVAEESEDHSGDIQGPPNSLSLHDVFGGEEESKS